MQSLGRHTANAVLKLPRAAAPQADSGQSPSPGRCFTSCRGTGKADSLFLFVHLFFFSVEIRLCAYGDEEPQLQPGGEEVRAPQNPSVPTPNPCKPAAPQPGQAISLSVSSWEGVRNPSCKFAKVQGMGPAWRAGDGAGEGPREDKSTESGVPVGSGW